VARIRHDSEVVPQGESVDLIVIRRLPSIIDCDDHLGVRSDAGCDAQRIDQQRSRIDVGENDLSTFIDRGIR
jgi:hypothetical protein